MPKQGFHDTRTNADDIELEASLQQLLLDLLGDAVEADVASGEYGIPLIHCHGHLGFGFRLCKYQIVAVANERRQPILNGLKRRSEDDKVMHEKNVATATNFQFPQNERSCHQKNTSGPYSCQASGQGPRSRFPACVLAWRCRSCSFQKVHDRHDGVEPQYTSQFQHTLLPYSPSSVLSGPTTHSMAAFSSALLRSGSLLDASRHALAAFNPLRTASVNIALPAAAISIPSLLSDIWSYRNVHYAETDLCRHYYVPKKKKKENYCRENTR